MPKAYYLITYRRQLLIAETVTPPMVHDIEPEDEEDQEDLLQLDEEDEYEDGQGLAALGIRARGPRKEHFPDFAERVRPQPITTVNKQIDHVTEVVHTESPHVHFMRMMKNAERFKKGQNSEDLALLYVKELTPEEVAAMMEEGFINEAPVSRPADAEEPVSPE